TSKMSRSRGTPNGHEQGLELFCRLPTLRSYQRRHEERDRHASAGSVPVPCSARGGGHYLMVAVTLRTFTSLSHFTVTDAPSTRSSRPSLPLTSFFSPLMV